MDLEERQENYLCEVKKFPILKNIFTGTNNSSQAKNKSIKFDRSILALTADNNDKTTYTMGNL